MKQAARPAADAILAEIARGETAPVYLIHGPDRCRHEELVAALQAALVPPGMEAFLSQRVDGPSVSSPELLEMAEAVPFGGGPRLLVVWNFQPAKDAPAAADPLPRYLAAPSPFTCLVLSCPTELPVGHALVQAAARCGRIVPAAQPRRGELAAWARAYLDTRWGKTLDAATAGHLVDRCQQDRVFLRGELDKLACYAGARPVITVGDLRAVVGRSREERVFDWLDAMGDRRTGRALRLVREFTGRGEEPLGLLSLLARQVRLAWQAKALLARGEPPGDIGRLLRVHPYVAEKTVRQARKLDEHYLGKALEAILMADLSIKNGTCPPELALETLCVKLCEDG